MKKTTENKINNNQFLEDLFGAYFDARKNKRNTKSAILFELNFEKNIFKLCEEINNRTYKPGQSIAFIVKNPIKREVFAAEFRDRVVHHLLFNYLNPIFEPLFINDSYSCRKGKGTLYGIKRAEHFTRSCSKNYQKEAFVLKLDISGYFMNIDKKLLHYRIKKELLKNKSKLKGDLEIVLYLLEMIIFSDPTKNFRLRGKKEDWQGLPKSKSLFFAPEGKGLPIGNLTSQLFGNIYLNDFDNYIKRKLRVKYYGRYVDDMLFFSTGKKELSTLKQKIAVYLGEDLGLRLHPGKIYLQKIEKGFDFLGVRIKPYRILIGKRLKGNFYKAIVFFTGEFKRLIRVNSENLILGFYRKVVATFNSYLGMMGHFNSFNLRLKLTKMIEGSFRGELVFDNYHRKVTAINLGGKCVKKY